MHSHPITKSTISGYQRFVLYDTQHLPRTCSYYNVAILVSQQVKQALLGTTAATVLKKLSPAQNDDV
jgi:hypothetical protein